MKNFLLFSTCLLGSMGLSAQTIVSTTVQKKNVVLEEYTGYKCTFCPDGHKRAAKIATDNPGKVVLINVHTGGYATPSGSDLDFRTSFGAALAGQTGLQGYPSGTVNRHVFAGSNTARNRGQWAGDATTIMGQNSPVNIAIKPELNFTTRKLTVLVELYYTDPAAAGTANKLNVALLQNNILGKQTGATSFYPANIDAATGLYKHNHALRHLLTGQWGDPITVASGPFVSKTYTYTIPSSIKNIPVDLTELEVAAFIVKDKQEIYSGVTEKIAIPTAMQTKVGMTKLSSKPADHCAAKFTPSIKVQNKHADAITSFEVSYILNGGTPVKKTFSGNLAQNQSTTVTFPAINLAPGTYDIKYTGIKNINGGAKIDIAKASVSGDYFTIVPTAAKKSPYKQDFESAQASKLPSNVFVYSPDKIQNIVVDKAFSSNLQQNNTPTDKLGGKAESEKSVWWNYFSSASGKSSSLILEKIDLSDKSGKVTLKFNYAHALYNGNEPDEMDILVSDDCGSTWKSVWKKVGTALQTTSAVGNNKLFFPKKADWKEVSVDLSSYAGKANVLVKFAGKSGYGNGLYLDDINVDASVSVNEITALSSINTYPNPASDNVTVDVNMTESKNMEIIIYDVMGKVVYRTVKNFAAGYTSTTINTQELSNGVYFLDIVSGSEKVTTKLTISK